VTDMYIGIDIGGTTIKGLITDHTGRESGFSHIDTLKTPREIDDSICELIRSLSTTGKGGAGDVEAIGIGTPGSIDRDRGTILKSPNIPGFRNHPLARNIEKRTGVKVVLENDATVALIGAWWKVIGDKYHNWIMITLGTGIGGGLVIHDEIYTGISGSAMEIGHMTIDYKGRKCPCGSQGCWERYASATGIVELARSKLKKGSRSSIRTRIRREKLTALLIQEEALKKDRLALEIYKEYAEYLGIGLANLVNIFNPEAVVIGGGLSHAHRLFLPVAKKVVKERSMQGLWEHVRYIPLADPEKIPSFGAAKIALDSLNT
jgi:glucokinase